MFAYQYDNNGYYRGAIEDYGLLPSNATHVRPALETGYIPRWNGAAWLKVENHIGQKGFLNGHSFEMREYGPLPEGFSNDPPKPAEAELFERLRSMRDFKLSQTDYLLMNDYPADDALLSKVRAYRQALRDLPQKEGAPWDGGLAETPWPVKDF